MESILDHPVVSARYFFPRREPLPGAFNIECDDVRLGCYFNAPHPEGKTLVYFHGNGEVVGESVELLAEPFAALGLNAFFAEYRGYGLSTGKPALVGMLEDVPCMIRALGLSEDKIVLFGRSVGSIYALHATRHFPNVAGLVIESGIADPLERILLRVEPRELGVTMEELVAEVGKHLDHRNLLEAFRRPALFLHSRHDGLIDVRHAERMHDWSAGSKELVIFERGDHNSILHVNFDAYMSHLRRFVESLP
jgi:pimeloyl-ACP methyl ester carboxylesterase